MTEAEFRAAPPREFARTASMNLVFIHRCGAVVGYPTLVPITDGLTCTTCHPMFGPEGEWLGIGLSDVEWEPLKWGDPRLDTAEGVPPLSR